LWTWRGTWRPSFGIGTLAGIAGGRSDNPSGPRVAPRLSLAPCPTMLPYARRRRSPSFWSHLP
jgi:hypothetical protein